MNLDIKTSLARRQLLQSGGYGFGTTLSVAQSEECDFSVHARRGQSHGKLRPEASVDEI